MDIKTEIKLLIDKEDDKEVLLAIKALLEKVIDPSIKDFNTKKYSGTLKLKEDPLKTQQRLREEWEDDDKDTRNA